MDHDHSGNFENQAVQIACLGVWHIITGKPMKERLEPVRDHRWENKTGVFITLTKNGAPRGSMGMLESTTVLPETLFDAGITAATHDSRFAPIDENELKDLEIEVTLLSEVETLEKSSDLVIGEMGLIVSRGENRGVLLPQAAVENSWSPEQFLEACCEKAKLSHKAWRDPNTLVEYFTCHIIKGGNLIQKINGLV